MSDTDPVAPDGASPAVPPDGADPGAAPTGDEGEAALPRFLGTWKRAYIVVILALAVEVVLLRLMGHIGQ